MAFRSTVRESPDNLIVPLLTILLSRGCLGALLSGLLMTTLPREKPCDEGGHVDYIGTILGVGSLILFNFVWK